MSMLTPTQFEDHKTTVVTVSAKTICRRINAQLLKLCKTSGFVVLDHLFYESDVWRDLSSLDDATKARVLTLVRELMAVRGWKLEKCDYRPSGKNWYVVLKPL